jgi:signal recognition particle receptor subunit beta
LGDVPFLVAANKQDVQSALSPAEVEFVLALDGAGVPVLPCVATDVDTTRRVLLSLFQLIIKRPSGAPVPE